MAPTIPPFGQAVQKAVSPYATKGHKQMPYPGGSQPAKAGDIEKHVYPNKPNYGVPMPKMKQPFTVPKMQPKFTQ